MELGLIELCVRSLCLAFQTLTPCVRSVQWSALCVQCIVCIPFSSSSQLPLHACIPFSSSSQLPLPACLILTACVCLQEEDAVEATVDSVLWTSTNSIPVCLNSGPDANVAHMAMLKWEVWDTKTLGTEPVGLSVRKAGFFDVQDATPSQQTPHMRGLIVPQWNIALAMHRNASDYHMKVFGRRLIYCKLLYNPFGS